MKLPCHFVFVLVLSWTVMYAHANSIITIQQAEELVRDGKGAEAAEALREITQKNPDDVYALYNYGIACYATGQFLEASRAFEEVGRGEDREMRSLALTQMGNAQFRLGQALLEQRNKEGAAIALERAVNEYREATEIKSSKTARHNLEVVGAEYKKLMLELAESRLKRGLQTSPNQKAWMRIKDLAEAVDLYQRVADFDPKDKEVQEKLQKAKEHYAETMVAHARQKREEAYAASEKAEALAEQIESETNKKQKQKLQKEASKQRWEENKARAEANANYEQALDVLPEDKSLQKEVAAYKKEQADFEVNDARAYLAEADSVEEENLSRKLREEEKLLAQASERVNRALELDSGHQRAEQLREEVQKRQEENFMAQAKENLARAEEQAERAKERSLGPYNAAAEDFRQALELNPENKEAQAGLEKSEQGLAEAYIAAGEQELEKAEKMMAAAREKQSQSSKQPKDPSQKQQNQQKEKKENQASEKTASAEQEQKKAGQGQELSPEQLQEQIGHLEKAAQSFAQAESIAPGENDARQKAEEATEQLNETRNQLDEALAQARQAEENESVAASDASEKKPSADSNPPSANQSPQPSDSEATVAEGKPPEDYQAVQILSFSEVRGKSGSEGDFSDNSDDSFVRDW